MGSGGVYIRGGSVTLSRALARVVRKSGGDILLGRRAIKIELASDGRPAAIHHAGKDESSAERIEARVILANCSPYAVAGMLASEQRAGFLARYDGLHPSISLFSAHFGLREPPQRFGLSGYSTVLLPDWMQRLDDYAQAGGLLADAPAGRMPPLSVVNYGAIDAGLDEDGQTLVTVVGVDRVANWREGEAERRAAWLEAIEQELERHFPGFAGAVTEKTMVTARSVRDYLGTPEGAVYGFAPTPPERSFLVGVPRSPRTAIPGLFLASAFAGGGGYTGAMGAGAGAAEAAEKFLVRR
jgi:phytoene dehydrogenase-like protein